MSNQDERDAILAQFTCAHIRLTRAQVITAFNPAPFHWAPGCVHPKMHLLFNGEAAFCNRCPCYAVRPDPQR